MPNEIDRLYERVLVLRCQTGDEAAFEELVARYNRHLHGYMTRMMGDGHRADDALQDAWLDVFRNLPRLLDAGAFRAWLFRIARNRVYRTLRKRRIDVDTTDPDDVSTASDNAPGSSEIDVEQVHRALDRLAPAHREVLVLRFLDGLSYEEIASVVGCPLGTVRSRIHNAKRTLRRTLERITDGH